MDKDILAAITNPEYQKVKKALATIIRRKGSAPRSPGAKMLVLEDGRCIGTIGGGCAEAEVRGQALQVLAEGKPAIVEVDLTNELAGEEGMVCGGILEVFIEPIS